MFHDDEMRGIGSRVLILATDDSGAEQYHAVDGLPGESFAKVISIRQHGLSSNPPPGSHAVMVALNGRRDLCVLLGGETGEHRPTGTPAGGTVLYDSAGTTVSLDAAGNITGVGAQTFKITMGQGVQLVVGGVTFAISSDGVAITGGSVTHNGVNIGATHKHLSGAAGRPTSIPE